MTKEEKPDPYELMYESLMTSVREIEEAETRVTKKKWIKLAREDYEDIVANAEKFSRAQLRRAERAIAFVDDEEASL
jgi:hypothetical protein